MEVTALIGSVKSAPGICEIKSQRSIMIEPIKMVEINNIL
jgi:hypothetical protein